MDWDVRKNLRSLLALFVFYVVIPHLVMSLVPLPAPGWEHDEAVTAFARVRGYLFLIWIPVPLSGGIVALRHVLKGGAFCPLFPIGAFLMLLTYFPRMEPRFVLSLLPSVLIILLMEACSLLNRFEGSGSEETKPGLLAGLSANRRFLTLLCFWSVVIPGVMQIAASFIAVWPFRASVLSVIVLVLVDLVLFVLALSGVQGVPLKVGGLAGTLVLFALSCLLCMGFYLHALWKVHLACVIVGYEAMFFMEFISQLFQRRKRGK